MNRLSIKTETQYKPLPKCLTIRDSKINGLGLFATKDIQEGTLFGISHYIIGDEIIRTPLGGFYNHSDNPNCQKMKFSKDDHKFVLVSIKNIKKDEEITVKYTFPQYEKHLTLFR